MRKLAIIALLLLLLILIIFPGCSFFGRVTGTGAIISKLYNISGFNEIEIGSSIEFEVVPLDIYSISIKANENIFDYVDVSYSGQTLFINLKPLSYSRINLVATITLPALSRISAKGTAHGKVKGFSSDHNFKLEASGDSTLDLDIKAGKTDVILADTCILVGRLIATDLNLEMSDKSRCSLNGSADNLLLNASGDTLANLPDYTIRNARVILGGTSQANLMLNNSLDAELNDFSTLNYNGNPELGKIEIRGASKIVGP